jgi:L-ascorbate metabolism protein UlaG (beta-lactamase superfamily)
MSKKYLDIYLIKCYYITIMQIYWYGQSFFKIEGKSAAIATDPFSKEIGLKAPKTKADILLVSHDFKHLDKSSGEGFLIEGPGEYEVKEVYIKGISSKDKKGDPNTIYLINIDGMKVAFLGGFGEKELSEKELDAFGDIDILILPIGDKDTVLNHKEAVHVINQVEPKITVPMYHKTTGIKVDLDGPEKFLKEVGIKPEKVEKLKIIKKELPTDESKLFIIETQ